MHAFDRQTDSHRLTACIALKILIVIFASLHTTLRTANLGDREAVRPSVCPSVKRVNCDKTKAASKKRLISTNTKSLRAFQ